MVLRVLMNTSFCFIHVLRAGAIFTSSKICFDGMESSPGVMDLNT